VGEIPTRLSQESISIGAPDTQATPSQFGAGIGAALQDVAGTIGRAANQFGDIALQEQNRKRAANVANITARSGIDMADIALRNRRDAPADGAGVAEKTYQEFQDYVEKTVAPIKDDVERQAVRAQLLGKMEEYSKAQKTFEYNQSEANDTLVADANIRGLENAIRSDSSLYETSIKDGEAIIDARPGLDILSKNKMKTEWRQKAAFARFEALLASAKTEEDFDSIKTNLEKGDKDHNWDNEFAPENKRQLLNDIEQAKKFFRTKADEDARAALEGVDAQLTARNLLDPEQFDAIEQQVNKSSNPITHARFNSMKRKQEILTKLGKQPPRVIRDGADNITGDGYPGLPPEIAGPIDEASRVFGVPKSYLGGTVDREYGIHVKRGGANVDPKFRPTKSGMMPKTYRAAALAGQLFGKPLTINSGYRSEGQQLAVRLRGDPNRRSVAKHSYHTRGTAIDVSTVGMSGAEKGKLVDSLAAAGFTGFGEYGTHIHADFRTNVPGSFNPATRQGGWSTLSPEVMDVLVKRGFKAGTSADSINRDHGAVISQPAEKTDWTKGTVDGDISVIGPYQFKKETWLELMADKNIINRIPGLDLTGKSQAEILAMRGDPSIATYAAAGLASKHIKYLTVVLGRAPEDAELYMAHFLGDGGANTFFSAYKENPDRSAAEILPKAAANNKSVFYGKNGKALTVKEVYDKIALDFVTEPSRVKSQDSKYMEDLADAKQKEIDKDPMTVAKSDSVPISDLPQQGLYTQRGVESLSVANRYNIPVSEMKPFTEQEAADLIKAFKDSDTNTQLAIVTRVKSMDEKAPGMGDAGLDQLGVKNTSIGVAAHVAERDESVARTILEGHKKRLEGSTYWNPAQEKEMLQQFNTPDSLGAATLGMDPAVRNSLFQAALDHAVELSPGKEITIEGFNNSLKAVIGNTAIVNGYETVVPEGLENTLPIAVEKLTDADIIANSKDQLPPIDSFGTSVSANDISREGRFENIGGNQYKVYMGDDGVLGVIVGEGSDKRLEAYVFIAEAQKINEIAARPDKVEIDTGAPTVEDKANEQLQLKYGIGTDKVQSLLGKSTLVLTPEEQKQLDELIKKGGEIPEWLNTISRYLRDDVNWKGAIDTGGGHTVQEYMEATKKARAAGEMIGPINVQKSEFSEYPPWMKKIYKTVKEELTAPYDRAMEDVEQRAPKYEKLFDSMRNVTKLKNLELPVTLKELGITGKGKIGDRTNPRVVEDANNVDMEKYQGEFIITISGKIYRVNGNTLEFTDID
jgi:hypothetical protein